MKKIILILSLVYICPAFAGKNFDQCLVTESLGRHQSETYVVKLVASPGENGVGGGADLPEDFAFKLFKNVRADIGRIDSGPAQDLHFFYAYLSDYSLPGPVTNEERLLGSANGSDHISVKVRTGASGLASIQIQCPSPR